MVCLTYDKIASGSHRESIGSARGNAGKHCRRAMAHVKSVEHLRAELQKGIDSLDHDLGREIEIEQLIRAARAQDEGQ
jgi:hypothetical protein